MAISGIFPAFSAGKKFFSKIGLSHIMSIAYTHLCAKHQKKLNEISRKCQKTVFPAYFRHFRRENMFFENRARSHLGHCHFASLCQKSEKTNEPISRKAGNRRTDGRTNERTTVNLQDLRGRSKKNNGICGKSPKKICRNGDFQHIFSAA